MFNLRIILNSFFILLLLLTINACGDSSTDSSDSDSDGILNELDKFPTNPAEWLDTDNDSIGDNSDPDIDGDGLLNDDDIFPLNALEWLDTDNDGLGNNSDPDIDGDSILNDDDIFPLDALEWLDSDNDGLGNNSDPDIDGDSILNDDDIFPLDALEWLDTDKDGLGNNSDPDIDGDSILNDDDAFAIDALEWLDTDKDGLGNNSDPDIDADKILNDEDDEPLTYNPDAFGSLIDSPVNGVKYIAGEYHGITGENGEFSYLYGDSITFYIGDIILGEAIQAQEVITPYELTKNNAYAALNIARLLQSLDNDENLDNGIQIHISSHELADNESLNFNSDTWKKDEGMWEDDIPDETLNNLIKKLTSETETGSRELISASNAYYHFSNILDDMMAELKEKAIVALSVDDCETDDHCKILPITTPALGYCLPGDELVVFSTLTSDLEEAVSLLINRQTIKDIKVSLRANSNPLKVTGSCWRMVQPLFPSCNTHNQCELVNAPIIRE